MSISGAEQISSGVWKIRLGEPEKHTPTHYRANEPLANVINALPNCEMPFEYSDVRFTSASRGCIIDLPLADDERIFGLGMNLRVFDCTGTRKTIRVSDNQLGDAGDSHAPVPFYVSSKGYSVFIDTARYASFYCGNLAPVDRAGEITSVAADLDASTQQLYRNHEQSKKRMIIEVPVAQGVDIYIFGGPGVREAIQRYVLFSGGGVLPPLWGLGVFYRSHTKSSSREVLELSESLRQRHIPCDVIGLEPGWQSAAYSCSFVWSSERWPDPDAFINKMLGMDYKLNLWEHAFTHPTSPLHKPLLSHCGDYRVWRGLVPDFADLKARELFADYHEHNLARKGISGFKLDECDNQPLSATPWSFPEHSKFGSGLDGEQMHSLFGVLYQQVLDECMRKCNIRTYSKVRASHALASSLPFVLYSDAYDHRDFVRAILTSGFAGVLWSPEVREAKSVEELYRRLQTSVLSAQTVINAWYLKNPPWRQIEREKNCKGEYMQGWEDVERNCKQILELRMRLIPYLYSSFADYKFRGIPPFRALVVDYPSDLNTHKIDDEYMIGESLLVAPLFAGEQKRTVYLPEGEWHDFWTFCKYTGKQEHMIEAGVDRIPIFVKSGTILPLAEPVEFIASETEFNITCLVFGLSPQPTILYEDDGTTLDFENGIQNTITLTWSHESGGVISRHGDYAGPSRYKLGEWRLVNN